MLLGRGQLGPSRSTWRQVNGMVWAWLGPKGSHNGGEQGWLRPEWSRVDCVRHLLLSKVSPSSSPRAKKGAKMVSVKELLLE